jgi:hypothetical protein
VIRMKRTGNSSPKVGRKVAKPLGLMHWRMVHP